MQARGHARDDGGMRRWRFTDRFISLYACTHFAQRIFIINVGTSAEKRVARQLWETLVCFTALELRACEENLDCSDNIQRNQ